MDLKRAIKDALTRVATNALSNALKGKAIRKRPYKVHIELIVRSSKRILDRAVKTAKRKLGNLGGSWLMHLRRFGLFSGDVDVVGGDAKVKKQRETGKHIVSITLDVLAPNKRVLNRTVSNAKSKVGSVPLFVMLSFLELSPGDATIESVEFLVGG